MDEQLLIERPVHEESIYEGKVVRLHRLDVTLPDGKPAMREVVRHVGACAVVPVDEQGNVILVRQYRAPLGRVISEIPAGKLESKAEDHLEAAKRELEEETGYRAENWTKLVDLATTPGFCDEVITVYLATGLHAGDTHPDDDEFLSVIRVPLNEAVQQALRGEFEDSKTLCGLLMAQKKLEE